MRCYIEKIGVHILAFLVARCQLLGMYPFVVPFFMAAYIQERSSMSLFFCLMFGLLSKFELVATFRYGLTIVVLVAMLGRIDRMRYFENNLQIALAAGMILWAVGMPYQYLVTGNTNSVVYTLLEGVIATCFVLLLEKGFEGIRSGTERYFATNERLIGIIALTMLSLFGLPVLDSPIHIPFVVCGYLLLYTCYRFEASVGMTMGSVVGIYLAICMENVSMLAVMIAVTGTIVLLRGLGRIGLLLGYVAGMILLGYLYETTLLHAVMLKSIVSVAILFFVTPKRFLRSVTNLRRETASVPQEVLLQEATKLRIADFGQAFLSMEKMLQFHEENREEISESGLSNIYLSGDGLSLLNVVEAQKNRVVDIRRNFIHQLGKIGQTITSFQEELPEHTAYMERFENRIVDTFQRVGIVVKKTIPMRDKESRYHIYVSCYSKKGTLITGKEMAENISKIVGRKMVCVNRGDDAITRQESCFHFIEKGRFYITTGVVRKNRNGERSCGDNFSITKLDTQEAVCMISDGMGSGEQANIQSGQVVDLLEQLLLAGFGRDLAIELLNSFVSFLADGTVSTTVDLTMIDLYTGDAKFVKLGASTTFIKRKKNVDCIRSTSLPMGILEEIEFDTYEGKLYHGDIIIMVSDGVLDNIIVDDKERYFSEFVANLDTNNVQFIAEAIMQDVESMQRGALKDDSTVLAIGLWER